MSGVCFPWGVFFHRRTVRPTRLTPRDLSPEYDLQVANDIDPRRQQVLAALRAELLADRSIRRRYKSFIRRSHNS